MTDAGCEPGSPSPIGLKGGTITADIPNSTVYFDQGSPAEYDMVLLLSNGWVVALDDDAVHYFPDDVIGSIAVENEIDGEN